MSPVGDLALSPGRLRVLARVRLFLQYFAGDLVVVWRRSWASFGDCAVPGREDAVPVGGVLLRGFSVGVSVGIQRRGSVLPEGGFLRSLWHRFSLYLLASALSLSGQCNSLRRVSAVIFGG